MRCGRLVRGRGTVMCVLRVTVFVMQVRSCDLRCDLRAAGELVHRLPDGVREYRRERVEERRDERDAPVPAKPHARQYKGPGQGAGAAIVAC